MRQFFKRWLLPLTIAAVTQTSIVSAEVIRLIGPNGEVQSAPRFSRDIGQNTTNNSEPSRFFGPTSPQDTLWSIATQLRPSANVSVQQTLLAIYRLNPQAFENQNIHSLLPGSTLRIPSIEQINRASTQEAITIMAAHQARLTGAPEPAVAAVPMPARPSVAPPVTEASPVVEQPAPSVVPDPIPAPAPLTDVAQAELLALEEKNHQLRLLLAQMQSEVSELKHELGDDNRIRAEVERLLNEDRRNNQQVQQGPSTWEQLLSSTWFVALLALIPGLLIAGIVMLLLSRRSKADQPEPVQSSTEEKVAPPPVAPVLPEEGEELGDDDLLLDDDLFGESDSSEILYGDDMAEEEDVFASLDEGDMDLNLDEDDDPFAGIDDDGDLDTNFADLAENQPSSDELDEEDFDLAEEDPLSQDAMDALLAGDEDELLSGNEVDQALLDELLMEAEVDDAELDLDSQLDELKADSIDSGPELTSDEELDSLLDSIQSQTTEPDQADEVLDDLLDGLVGDDLDLSLDDDSTELLDELLVSDELSEQDLDTAVDKLLDELLDESDVDEALSFDHDSPTLLDEWIDEQEPKVESNESVESDPQEAINVSLDDGTEFLDELLEIEQQAEVEDSEFDSNNFIDDLISNAPAQDPLLDDIHLEDKDESTLNQPVEEEEFDFDPQIEGGEAASASDPEPLANEFGVPQDEDWLVDDEDPEPIEPLDTPSPSIDEAKQEVSALDGEVSEPSTKTDTPEEILEVEEGEKTDVESSFESEDQASIATDGEPQATQSDPTESENEPLIEQTEVSDVAHLIDEEPDAPVLPETEGPLSIDESELAEYTEQDALADLDDDIEQLDTDSVTEPSSVTTDTEDADENDAVQPEQHVPSEEESLSVDSDELENDDSDPEPESSLVNQVADQDTLEEQPETQVDQAPSFDLDSMLESVDDDDRLSDIEQLEPQQSDSDSEDIAFDAALETIEDQDPESIDENGQHAEPSEDGPLNIDESQLAEYTEQDALADLDDDVEEVDADSVTEPLTVATDSQGADESNEAVQVEPPTPSEEELLSLNEDESESDDLDSEPEPESSLVNQVAEQETLEQQPDTQQEQASSLDADVAVESDHIDEVLTESVEPAELAQPDSKDPSSDVSLESIVNDVDDTIVEPDNSQPDDSALEPSSEQEDGPLSFDESELAEYTEQDALADTEFETESEVIFDGDEDAAELDDIMANFDQQEELETPHQVAEHSDLTDQQDTASIAAEPEPEDQNDEPIDFATLSSKAYNEQQFTDLLNDPMARPMDLFNSPLDAKTIDSAGMDIDAMLQMGGEDWNGFSLTEDQKAVIPDEIPEEDQAIWQEEIQNQQPEVEVENWENQEDVVDFSPEKREFMTVDELMAQVERDEGSINPDDEALKLDVGLDEFPDVLGDITDFDVDNNAEAAGKLDLAKIYLEMNDSKGAIKLLEEAIVDGDDEIRRQAKYLIDRINGRQ
ncbi:AAA family ATPase [Vibrio metschnikovii]|nr:AAA family ATPase [Vibrio metschnikovii]